MTAVENELLQIASKRFDLPSAKLSLDDDFFERLGINSFQALDLLTDVEEHFGVEIPDYELQGVNTLRGIAALISKRK